MPPGGHSASEEGIGCVRSSHTHIPPTLTSHTSSLLPSHLTHIIPLTHTHTHTERHLLSSPWERHVFYPLSFLVLLTMTLFSLLLVATNTLSLLLSPSSLPSLPSTSSLSTLHHQMLGSESTSRLGVLGAILEVSVILYLPHSHVQHRVRYSN